MSGVESKVEAATRFAPARRSSPTQLRRQAKALKDRLEIEFLVDAIPDIVLVLNCDRQTVLANRAASHTLQIDDVSSVLGLRPGEISDCSNAFETKGGCGTAEVCGTCGAVMAVLAGLEGHADTQECRITRRSGDAVDLRVRAVPIEGEGERFVLFIIRDISLEKRKEAMERIFFHDVLNTAGNLRGFTDLLGEAAPGQIEEFRHTIRKLGNQLIQQISSQRDLIAAEDHMLSVNLTAESSRDLLEEAAEDQHARPGRTARLVSIDPAAADVSIVTDRTLLSRVLGDMVRNALEASPPGDTVTLGCDVEGDQARFWVHNPGHMPRDLQLQVFQRSFTTKGNGRGLGAYRMKLLSERYLGGTVSFATSEHEGTTFSARYPLKPAGPRPTSVPG